MAEVENAIDMVRFALLAIGALALGFIWETRPKGKGK